MGSYPQRQMKDLPSQSTLPARIALREMEMLFALFSKLNNGASAIDNKVLTGHV